MLFPHKECYPNMLEDLKDPEFFDLHEQQSRVVDYLRMFSNARWGFYHSQVITTTPYSPVSRAKS